MNSLASSIGISPEVLNPVNPTRGVRGAHDFEACLVASLLESLEKTYATLPGEEGMPGADDYNYLGTQALAAGITARGGFGIADMISRDLSAHEGKR